MYTQTGMAIEHIRGYGLRRWQQSCTTIKVNFIATLGLMPGFMYSIHFTSAFNSSFLIVVLIGFILYNYKL